MKVLFVTLTMLLFCFEIFAQSSVKIAGYVLDSQTGMPVIGANIIVEGSGNGASTNERGYFELENLFLGTYAITAGHISYFSKTISDIKVLVDQTVKVQFKLKSKVFSFEGVKIFAEKMSENPASNVITVTKKQIERLNYNQISEVLDNIPGLEIQNTGGSSGRKKISIRGSQINQVLVLLDGVPLNDNLSGEVDLSIIPLNHVEKIEIYKSGQTPQFGSGAIAGVLNITTKQTLDNQLSLDSYSASFGAYKIEPTWAWNHKNLQYFFSYGYTESEGNYNYSYLTPDQKMIAEKKINSDLLSRNLFARINYRLGSHLFAIDGQKFTSYRGIPGKVHFWTAYARVNTSRDLLGFTYKYDSNVLKLSLFLKDSNSKNTNSNLWPDSAELRDRRYPRYNYRNTVKTSQFQSFIKLFPANRIRFNLGYERRLSNYNDENLLQFNSSPIGETRGRSHGFYISQEYNSVFTSWRSQVFITPIIRYDEIRINNNAKNRFEHRWSPGFSIILFYGSRNSIYLKSNMAKSFRVPTYADLFYQDFRIQGKSDLLPEKSVNIDINFGWQVFILGKIKGEISYFNNKIQDLIVWRLGNFETFSPFNTDAEISGMEYYIEMQTPNEFINFNFGYTVLQPINKSRQRTTHNKILPYRPKKSVKTGIQLRFKSWQGNFYYRFSGSRFVTEANTIKMPEYQVFDCFLSQKISFRSVKILLKFSIFNVANKRFAILEGMPLPPREYRLGVNINYNK